MKVVALTEGVNHVCYRYRVAAFADALAARGCTLEEVPLSRTTFRRTAQLRACASADVAILQRKLLPLWQLRVLRAAAPALIYDFDDAIFRRDSYSKKPTKSWTRLAHFWATIYAADAVFAGNEYLRDQAACYVEPERVHLVPTCVDTRRYPLSSHQGEDGRASMIWIGQPSTMQSLSLAHPMLRAASQAAPRLDLRVICSRFPDLDGVNILPVEWSEKTEAAELATADIGISFLPDDEWSIGKCGLKVLQYMAAGLPVIANPVGMNSVLVEHGRTGYLASTPREWAEAARSLVENRDLRIRMGREARRVVENRYSVHAWQDRFAEMVVRFGRRTIAPFDRASAAQPPSRAMAA